MRDVSRASRRRERDAHRVLEEGRAAVDRALLVARHGPRARLGVVHAVVLLRRQVLEEVGLVLLDVDLLRARSREREGESVEGTWGGEERGGGRGRTWRQTMSEP